jgi:hypothetical protein
MATAGWPTDLSCIDRANPEAIIAGFSDLPPNGVLEQRPYLIKDLQRLHDDPAALSFDGVEVVPAERDLVQVPLQVLFAQTVISWVLIGHEKRILVLMALNQGLAIVKS